MVGKIKTYICQHRKKKNLQKTQAMIEEAWGFVLEIKFINVLLISNCIWGYLSLVWNLYLKNLVGPDVVQEPNFCPNFIWDSHNPQKTSITGNIIVWLCEGHKTDRL